MFVTGVQSVLFRSSGDESEGESKEGIFKDKEGRKRLQAAESDRSLHERYQIAYKNRKTLDWVWNAFLVDIGSSQLALGLEPHAGLGLEPHAALGLEPHEALGLEPHAGLGLEPHKAL